MFSLSGKYQVAPLSLHGKFSGQRISVRVHCGLQFNSPLTCLQAFNQTKPQSRMKSPSYSDSTSSSSTTSSGGSSPFPNLPDEVLRSFQLDLPDPRPVYSRSDNAVEAHRRGSGRSLQQSVNADDYRDAAATANDENHTQIQHRNRNNLSEYDIRDLRLIHAHYKSLASKHREQMIREIEANCEELGLNVRQQDWAALLESLTATGATGSRPGTTANQRDFSQREFEEEVNPHRDYFYRIAVSEVTHGSETAVTDDGTINSSSDMPAESEASLSSLWAPRGRKRAHSQLEQQDAYTADDHENGQAEAVMVQARSRALIRSLHSGDAGNVPRRERNSSIVFVNGIAKRTAWSVVLDRYPDEVAMVFRAGQRPENSQVRSMVSSQPRVSFRSETRELMRKLARSTCHQPFGGQSSAYEAPSTVADTPPSSRSPNSTSARCPHTNHGCTGS